MSGRKRIQVDQSEWYRIQRQAQQLKDVRRDIPRLVENVRDQTRADLDRSFTRVRQEQRRHEEAVRALSERTRQAEADTTRRLREQADRLHRALGETAGHLREETRRELARQQEQTRQAIAAERAERRAETARLSQDVEIIKEGRARAEELVRTWLADARTMAGLVDALPHGRYAPGELEKQTKRLATAEGNAAEGVFDAALALTQETFHSLSDLRVEVTQHELERCTAQAEAVETLVRLDQLIDGNRERPVIGPDGEALAGYKLNVVHWSQGEFEELQEETRKALARARADATDTDELRRLRDREAPRLEQALGDAVERAGMRHLASQIRVNLADAVAQTLGEHAYYDVVDGEYADGDERGAYFARLRNEANGNEIVVDVSEAAPDSGQCVIRVLSYDHDTTAEADLLKRAQAIRQALVEDGLGASAPQCEPGTPDPALPDRITAQSHARPAEQKPGTAAS